MSLLPLILLIPLMYLLLIRPQQRRVAQARALMESLQVGEKVVTAGGMIGTIESMDERTITMRVTPDVVLTFIRPAVTRRYEEAEEADDTEDADVRPEEQD
jgi:preprotein translocase subunit YajC